jgi:hypothetical protein
MLRRWSKLEKDFYNKKKEKFEISKIPDIYDSIKYDLMHNRNIIIFENAYNLYEWSKALADIVVNQEYGITKEEKLKIARGIVTPLLKKIRTDLKSNLTGIWDCEDPLVNQLDPHYSKGIHSPSRHVRTRLYFTSESHIYSLLTVLKFGYLFQDDEDSQWKTAMDYLGSIPELNYLTQIVIMLYEDPSVEDADSNRFHIEIHFSPGSYTDLDQTQPHQTPPPRPPSSNDELLHISSGSEETTAKKYCSEEISSPKQNKSDKREKKVSAQTNKRYPIKLQKGLQTLHEPSESNTTSSMIESDDQSKETSNENISYNDPSKPRSFEDEHHQSRISILKGKLKIKNPYNHYNTFHGSSNQSYLSLSHVFKNKINQSTNSSPDLNQNLMGRNKKSSSSNIFY